MISSLRARGFRWLWMGQLLSQWGSAVFLVMGFWEIQLKAPFLLGVAGIAMALPQLLAVVGGVVVDRLDAGRVMFWTDVIRGTAVALALVWLLFRPGAHLWIIMGVLTVNSLGNALFGPAEAVAVPNLVLDQDLPSANGLYALTSQLSQAIGSGIGGAAIAAVGISLVFGIDMASFWFSALAIFMMMISSKSLEVNKNLGEPHSGSFRVMVSEGWRALSRMHWVIVLLPLILLTNFTFAGGLILLPYWMRHDLHSTALWYGVTEGAWSLGMLGGSMAARWLGRWPLRKTISVLGVTQGIIMALFALSHVPWESVLALFFGGICNGATNALIMTLFQRLIPESVRGRAFGLLITMVTAATPLAMGVAGLSIAVIPTVWWYLAMAVTDVMFGVGLWRVAPSETRMEGQSVTANQS